MKKTVIILLLLALAVSFFACSAAPEQPTRQTEQTEQTQPPQPDDTQPPQQTEDNQPRQITQVQNTFTSEPEDDYVRYTGGGISILLESGFIPLTAEQGNIVYSNGFLTVILTQTDDYDAQMLESSGYQMSELTEEDYGSLLIEANKLGTDSMFYDYFGNLCMTYTGENSDGTNYEAYSVIKKDTVNHTFWLLQFVGTPAVYEPYSVYFPEWAASAEFTH